MKQPKPQPAQPKQPKYRRQNRPNGRALAFIELNGIRTYLGEYGSAASRTLYFKHLAEWEANGNRQRVEPAELTVKELAAAYLAHASKRYRRPDGSETQQVGNCKRIVGVVLELYANAKVVEFDAPAVATVQMLMVRKGWARNTVNAGVRLVRHLLKWGVSRGLVNVAILETAKTVEALREGQTEAYETDPVGPVPVEDVEATLKHCSRQVAAMIQIQRLTGCRAGEIVKLRPVDIDVGGDVWTAALVHHKNAHREKKRKDKGKVKHSRTLYFGRRAKKIIKPFLAGRAVDAPLFSPKEAEATRYAACPTHRRAPVEPSTTDRMLGDAYTVDSYRRAVTRACDLADREAKAKLVEAGLPVPEDRVVERWSPHRLRHLRACEIVDKFGEREAMLVLGQESLAALRGYLAANEATAKDVMRRMG